MIVILVATDQEYELAKEYLSEFNIIKTGVGASNVIRACSQILIRLQRPIHVINVGFCGSNTLPKGTVAPVYRTFRLIDHTVGFVDYRNGYPLTLPPDGYDCYTSNDFVTEDNEEPGALYDMELNYIAAFPFESIASVKIVSDNLCVDEYTESIHTSTEETWSKVHQLVKEIASNLN